MTNEAIEFKNVVYSYRSSDFTLSVRDLVLNTDEITFIAGDNGSGKTTMAKLMTGILKPLSGEIILMGTPLKRLTLGETGQKLGYLWQDPGRQLFAQKVIDELTFVNEIKNPKQPPEKKKEAEDTALGWLEYFDLAHLAEKSCFYLSHGERQRLAIAAVIASGAKYLILDEPAKGLDDKRKNALADMLLKLRNEKKTGMSIISHDEMFMDGSENRRITLSKGEIVDG
jgi:energy-coupling factor transport system ATP-binding protein